MDHADESDSNRKAILPVISRLESAMSAVVNGDGEKAKHICNNAANIDLIVESIKRYIDQGECFEQKQKIDIDQILIFGNKTTGFDVEVQFDMRDSHNQYYAKFDISMSNDMECIVLRDVSM